MVKCILVHKVFCDNNNDNNDNKDVFQIETPAII